MTNDRFLSKPAVLHALGTGFRQLVAIPVIEALIYGVGGATLNGWLAAQAGRPGEVALAACVAGLAAVLPPWPRCS